MFEIEELTYVVHSLDVNCCVYITRPRGFLMMTEGTRIITEVFKIEELTYADHSLDANFCVYETPGFLYDY